MLAGPTYREVLLLAAVDVPNVYSADFESTSSQSAYCAAAAGVKLTSAYTIECWLKVESYPTGTSLTGICGQWDTSNNALQSVLFLLEGDGAGGAYIGVLGKHPSTSGYHYVRWAWTAGLATWAHFALTNVGSGDATARYELFQDTSSRGNGTVVANLSFTGQRNSTQDFTVASFEASAVATGFYDGRIDQLRLWDAVRTSTQIAAKWKTGLGGGETNLGALYQFENVWTDGTSNGNDLTALNTPTFPADPAY